jgi:hypothetical protein
MAIRYGIGPRIKSVNASDVLFTRSATPIVVITGSPTITETTVLDRIETRASGAPYYRNWNIRAEIYRDVGSTLASGEFISLDPSVADFVGTVLTRVSNGTARVQFVTLAGIWQDSCDVSDLSGEVTVSYEYSAGSLAKHITDSTIALVGSNVAANMPLFSTRDNTTPTYTRNTNCWAAPIDLTGASVWNSLGAQTRAGTAITPRHTLHALHYPVTIGTTLRFVAADNSVVTRTVSNVYSVPQSEGYAKDIQIALLDSDLPASITPFKFLPANAADYLPYWSSSTIPAIGTNQFKSTLCAPCRLVDTQYGTKYSALVETDTAPFSHVYTPIISGDSGCPAFLVVNSTPVLIAHWTFAGMGPAHHLLLTEIAAAITVLGGGHTLSTVDLSSFTDYS